MYQFVSTEYQDLAKAIEREVTLVYFMPRYFQRNN